MNPPKRRHVVALELHPNLNAYESQGQAELAWTSCSPLDEPVEYVVSTRPAQKVTRVVEAETALEGWFHSDISLKRDDGAIMDEGPACDMLVVPGGTPINFPSGYGVRTCHDVFIAAFDGFTKYERDWTCPAFPDTRFEATGLAPICRTA